MTHEETPFIDEAGNLHIPAQIIPLPKNASPEAQAHLRTRIQASEEERDREGWLAYAAQVDIGVEPRIDLLMRGTEGCTIETIEVNDVTLHVVTPPHIPEERRDWARLMVHGGGFVLLGGRYAAAEAAKVAVLTQCLAVAVDYRKPPDYPYPVPLDDVITAYEYLLETRPANKIAITGDSAGGNLAVAAVLKARDAGIPMPGAMTLSTPLVDLTQSGDSWATNRHLDYLINGKRNPAFDLYANGADFTDPYVSPLFADYEAGFPPTMFMTGTRDRLLSDSVQLHRKLRRAGIGTELHLWDAGPHGNFLDGPERDEQDAEDAAFVVKHLA